MRMVFQSRALVSVIAQYCDFSVTILGDIPYNKRQWQAMFYNYTTLTTFLTTKEAMAGNVL